MFNKKIKINIQKHKETKTKNQEKILNNKNKCGSKMDLVPFTKLGPLSFSSLHNTTMLPP